jgi:cation diffusion facilitator family transporter
MMVGELLAGWWTRSLALTADGWHMGTHALALGGAVIAYRLSRRAAREPAAGFVFGGWKIEVLAAYTSGLLLMAVALALAWDSVAALRAPRGVAWADAMVVAVIGLVVNVASAWLLSRGVKPASPGHADAQGQGRHDHHGPHDHHDHHHHPHAAPHAPGHDHNFSAAYLHVLADALTSVLAIAALAGGAWFGLPWLDPAAALLGAALIAHWSWNMLRSTARALVDATEDPHLAAKVRALIEDDGDARIADLHVWQVGSAAWCAALSVVADAPLPAHEYRARLTVLQTLRHVTVEVHRCRGPATPGSVG